MSFYTGNRTYVMQLRRTIKVPLERLYRALESGEDRSRWFSQSSDVELEVGGKFFNDNGAIGQFTEVIPMKRWRMEWLNPSHKPGSKVVIEFEKNGRWEAVVYIRHWRIKSKRDYQEIHQGWMWTLDSLESYLEQGKPIAYQQWLEANMSQA